MINILNGDKESNFLVICDHASNVIPQEYNNLGLCESVLGTHIAYDIGAREVAIGLADILDCPLIMPNFSRLLIDPNRGTEDPTLIMKISDGRIIEGNRNISFVKDCEDKKARIKNFYDPYHSSISKIVKRLEGQNILPSIISIHSFTPEWKGKKRKIEMGVLWDKDDRLAKIFLKYYENIFIGDNNPYSGRLKNDTLYKHGTRNGLPHVLIELRQDLINSKNNQKLWVKKIYKTLIDNDDTIGLFKRKKYGSFVG